MKLFKRDSRGEIRILEIFAEGDQVVQRSGLFDGKRSETRSSCIGKNIGRSNETSPEEQALLEAEAKIKKKLEKEYFTTKEEAEGSEVLLPMLAKDYKKEFHKIDWNSPVYVQPKLDGMRILAIKKDGIVRLISRENKEVTTLDHIKKQLQVDNIPDGIYDGEAYSLELGSFQEQMKAIKTYKKEVTEKIDFNIYDIILDLPFAERYKIICSIFS